MPFESMMKVKHKYKDFVTGGVGARDSLFP